MSEDSHRNTLVCHTFQLGNYFSDLAIFEHSEAGAAGASRWLVCPKHFHGPPAHFLSGWHS